MFQFLVPPGKRVLEIGIGRGNILASLRTARGIGVDFYEKLAEKVRRRHPDHRFEIQDARDLHLD